MVDSITTTHFNGYNPRISDNLVRIGGLFKLGILLEVMSMHIFNNYS